MSTTMTPPQAQTPPPVAMPPAVEKTPWYKREIYTARPVKPDEIMNFSRQLASFLRAGVPILDSLSVVAEENASKKLQAVVTDIQRRLRGGSSFGDAISAQPNVFPGYYIAVCRAAELTGRLDDALEELASDLEREVASRRQLRSSLTYPVIVLSMAIVAIVIMSAFVLPKFRSFYSGLGAKLPLPTRMLLGFTEFMAKWWWLLAIIGVALVVVALFVYGGSEGKERRDRMLLKFPAIGELIHLLAIERFCRVLAALVHSGVPLPDAVQVSADATNNRVFQKKLATARDAMIRGDGLARPIAASGLFPPAARQMIRVGESTGSLDAQLQSAAVFYERELTFRLKRFTDMFEPAIILIVGAIVTFVAVAQISAMYSVYHQVKI